MRTLLYAACALLVSLPLTACSINVGGWPGAYGSDGPHNRSQKTVHLNEDHVPGSAVEVRTKNGRIEVVAVPQRTDVSIEAEIFARGDTIDEAEERLAAITIEVTRRSDGTLVIEPNFPKPGRSGDGASIVVELPDASEVALKTSNGSVYASGLTGTLDIDTSNGAVEVFGHAGEADLNTSNGSITVDDHVGSLAADTSNGSVRISHVDGAVKAGTSNGSIAVTLHKGQRGPVNLDTSNGPITVRVGPGFAGAVSFDTSNGRVNVRDHAGNITNQSISKTKGRITVGEGGAPSRLDTSNGTIRFTISG